MKSYIAALRFPLAVLVVLIHANNTVWQGMEWGSIGGIPYFLTRVLPTFAVPLFFAMSGYLFFLNRREFGVADYVEKLRRRFFTLVVPYLLWNVLAFGLYALKDVMAGQDLQQSFSFNIFWGSKPLGTASVNAMGWSLAATTAPVLEQLWFVRDLIVCVLLTPLIYIVLKIGGAVGLLLFALVFYAQLWPNYGGMSFTGLWFFTLGAWFSISEKDPLRTTRRLLAPSLALLPPTWLALVLFPEGGEIVHQIAQPVCVLASMVASIHVADFFCRQRRLGKFLPASSFFLYACHTIVLLPLTAQAVCLSAGKGPLLRLLLFILCPVLAIALCLLLFYVLSRWLPRLSAPLTGIYHRR